MYVNDCKCVYIHTSIQTNIFQIITSIGFMAVETEAEQGSEWLMTAVFFGLLGSM